MTHMDTRINVKGTHHAYTPESFAQAYTHSLTHPEEFWREMAHRLDWYTHPRRINSSTIGDTVDIRWYEDGVLNPCYNTVDRHAQATPNKRAITWEGNEPDISTHYTYAQLQHEVSKCANVLKHNGIQKGDVVAIYMPMIPEAIFTMLACARIGAVHNVVFAGFSPQSLAERVQDSQARMIITADIGKRGDKTTPLKHNVDTAVLSCPSVEHVLLINTSQDTAYMTNAIDRDYYSQYAEVSATCPCEPMEAEAPLFILYTSGSTGKPKGLVHSTGGYLVYAGLTFENSFDYRADDVYWSSADIGWITGHSYQVYLSLIHI